MAKGKKSKAHRAKDKLLIAAVSLQMMALTAVPAFADKISDAAEGAASDAVVSMQGLGKPALMVVLGACGLIFLVGTQRQKDNWKDGLLIKIVGLGVLILAVPLADVIYGWFQ